ncbi:MAG: hypothetical protein AAFY34_13325, partial [Pseudomonadota bacterium]
SETMDPEISESEFACKCRDFFNTIDQKPTSQSSCRGILCLVREIASHAISALTSLILDQMLANATGFE